MNWKDLVLEKYPYATCKKSKGFYLVRTTSLSGYVSFEKTPVKAWKKAALLLGLTQE